MLIHWSWDGYQAKKRVTAVRTIYIFHIISWNKGVRPIFNMPYATHTYMLDPFLKHPQFTVIQALSSLKFRMLHNAKTPHAYNLAFFKNKYGIDIMCDDHNYCMIFIRSPIQENNMRIILNILEHYLYEIYS